MTKYRIVYENKRLEIPVGEFLIGRSAHCQLVLDDPSVSRVHAVIVHSDGAIRIEDRESRNGLLVNDERITDQSELVGGDVIAIGHQRMSIESIEAPRDADKTVGIRTCDECGSFTNANEPFCASCGSNIGVVPSAPPVDVSSQKQNGRRPDSKQSIVMEQQPMGAMAGLALKALQVGKSDESELLIAGALRTAFDKLERNKPLTDHGFATLSKALIEYAAATRSSEHISALFRLHLEAKQLMTRTIVDELYDTVRKAGYLSCTDMANYLAYLDTVENGFSPGEKFIHRRLQGLVKICS